MFDYINFISGYGLVSWFGVRNDLFSKNKGRFYRRKDDKYLIYLPVNLGTDSMFPFPLENDSDVHVKVSFDDEGQIVVEKWDRIKLS